MKIRKANKGDIGNLVEIVKGAGVLEDYFGEYSSKMLLKMINKKDFVFLVMEENNKVIGFINFEIEKEGKRIFLDTLAVHKDFKGRGIGSRLFDEMEKYVHKLGFKRLFFIVRDYNKEMNALAKKRKCKISCKLNYWNREYK